MSTEPQKPSGLVFAENLDRLLKQRDLSDLDISRILKCTRQSPFRWRTGRQEPSGAYRDALANELRKPVYWFFQERG